MHEQRAPTRSIGIFLLAAIIVWCALGLLVWPMVQPVYSGVVTGVAGSLITTAELGCRVTRLYSDGRIVYLSSRLSGETRVSQRFDARILHFYVVPCASMVLVFPLLGWPRRLRILGYVLGGLFVLHVLTLLVDTETYYAEEVQGLGYSHFEQSLWRSMDDFMTGGLVQLAPAVVLALLVVIGGGLRLVDGRAAAAISGTHEKGRSGAGWTIGSALGVSVLAAGSGLILQHDGVRARQAMYESVLGQMALEAGELARATGQFESAIQRDPQLPAARLGLGQALMSEGRPREAAVEFRALLELTPEDPRGHFLLGSALFKVSDYEEAIGEFDASLRLSPRQAQVLYDRALGLKIIGRRADGEADLKAAIAIDPDYADAVYELAASMINSHRVCEAMPYLEALARLEPDSERGLNANRAVGTLQAGCPGT